jgi:hypothetical protein
VELEVNVLLSFPCHTFPCQSVLVPALAALNHAYSRSITANHAFEKNKIPTACVRKRQILPIEMPTAKCNSAAKLVVFFSESRSVAVSRG